MPRHAEIWLPGYLKSRAARLLSRKPPKRVWFAICDHFEPLWRGADLPQGQERVAVWRRLWPELAAKIGPDSDGALPKYSFFYPQDEYFPELVEPLAELTRLGIADVEVHIHHDNDGRDAFIEKISRFCGDLIHRHGLLRSANGNVRFGFIHGNWALDNSRPDGRWCGLNDEITILRDLGCYADFTMPSGAAPTQARMVNQIYWATDDPTAPKSYDYGVPLTLNNEERGDLLIISGPLGVRWLDRLIPRMETAELAEHDPATPARVRGWFTLAPQIGDDLFIKLHTHGTQDKNSNLLLQHQHVLETYALVATQAGRLGASVHFVSAWEMFQAAVAAGQGTRYERHANNTRVAVTHL
ncbi:MAG TPA: hypothetical protein VGC88_06055 [Terriglobales bacterium]